MNVIASPLPGRHHSLRGVPAHVALFAVATLPAAVPAAAAAQDPVRGRDLYLNAAAIKATPMRSCVQCHGLPPDTKLQGASVAQLYGAFASVNEMSGFITAFTLADVTDLSAFLADPAATPTPLPVIEPMALRLAAPLAAISPAIEVVLRNRGTAPLRLATVPLEVSGPDAGAFLIAASSCASRAVLQPADACQFELRFVPQQARTSSAQLIVRYDTIAQPSALALSGEPQPRARFTHSVTGLAFGAQSLGLPAPVQSVRVVNAGFVPLTVAERRLDGPAAADFTLQGCAVGSVIAPGAACRLDVAFSPSTSGARSATLTLASPDAVEPMTLALGGTGQAAGAPAQPAPPPQAPPSPPASAPTNAGGGPVSPLALPALLVAAALRWRTRHG